MVRQLWALWLWSMQSAHFCINGFTGCSKSHRSEPSPTMLLNGESNSGTVCLLSLVFCKCVLSGQTICSQLIVGLPTHSLLVKFPGCSCFKAHNLGKFVSIWVKRGRKVLLSPVLFLAGGGWCVAGHGGFSASYQGQHHILYHECYHCSQYCWICLLVIPV